MPKKEFAVSSGTLNVSAEADVQEPVSADHVIIPPDPPPVVPAHESARKVEVVQKVQRLHAAANNLETIIEGLVTKLGDKLPEAMGPYVPKAAGQVLSAFAGELEALGARLEILATKLSDVHSNVELK